jgi:hypothetical protein
MYNSPFSMETGDLLNYCRPSPTQQILVSGPVGAHEQIFLLKTFMCSEMGPSLQQEEGSNFWFLLCLEVT